MTAKRAFLFSATLAICTTGWAAKKVDVGKKKVEASTKITIAKSAGLPVPTKPAGDLERPAKAKLDFGKRRIERATERLLAEQVHTLRQSAAATRSVASASENPKVAPGKILWHANFNAACAASRKSRKPVLLFQLLGNLDDRFC